MTRRHPGAGVALMLALVALCATTASGQAPTPAGEVCAPAAPGTSLLTADASRTGLIDLYFFNALGATVTYYECVGGVATPLGERSQLANGVETPFYSATQWRCDDLSRYFAATATLGDGTILSGTTSVQTEPCAQRFRLDAPSKVKVHQAVVVHAIDQWDLGGIQGRLCFISPAGRRRCQPVAFAVAVNATARRFHPTVRGDWRVELQVDGFRFDTTIAAGVRPVAATVPPPTLLATGDSTIGGVDSFLAADLGNRATVVSHEFPGSSLSLDGDDWTRTSAKQVAELRPSVTVISLGANEGFPMMTVDGEESCCAPGWVAEYTRRVHDLMLTYLQGGRGRVVYLTIVAPRQPDLVPAVDAVNGAIVSAAVGLPGVTVLRMDQLFSPDGYQEDIRYRGREVDVREPDGVHLNIAGTAIEAQAVASALGPL